ncbi:MAG: MFS transporter [Telmatospirillum sp.]|nr:MFS transporter [Telmatospirillum sp.]
MSDGQEGLSGGIGLAPTVKVSGGLWADPSCRRFLLATLIDWLGTGLLLTAGPVFLIRLVGLSAGQIGSALTCGALFGLGASIVIGALADRLSPRRVLIGLYLWRALMFFSYALFVRGFWSFLIVITLVQIAELSASPVTQALATGLGGVERRIQLLAYYRTVVNIGISMGGFAAAAALSDISWRSFVALLGTGGIAFLTAAWLIRTLPVQAPPSRPEPPDRTGRKGLSLRILGFALLDGILALYLVILNLALPVWIADHTHAPVQAASLLYAVNTILCVGLQVLMSRFATSLPGATRSLVGAGLLLALACVLIGWAGLPTSRAPSLTMLTLGVIALTFGEMLHSPASWRVSHALAPGNAQTRSFATFNLGRILGRVAGPMAVTYLVIGQERPGWIALAGGFLVAGLAMAAATARLARRQSGVALPEGLPT